MSTSIRLTDAKKPPVGIFNMEFHPNKRRHVGTTSIAPVQLRHFQETSNYFGKFLYKLVYRVYKNLANGLVVNTRTKEQADAQIFSQHKRSLVLCYDRPKSSTNETYII